MLSHLLVRRTIQISGLRGSRKDSKNQGISKAKLGAGFQRRDGKRGVVFGMDSYEVNVG
jgi:hypothetical protein